jgi:hypothetical protein
MMPLPCSDIRRAQSPTFGPYGGLQKIRPCHGSTKSSRSGKKYVVVAMRHDIPAQPHGSRSKGPSLCGMARGVSQSFVSPVLGFSKPKPPVGEDVEIGPAPDCATVGNSEVEELVMIMWG